MNNKGKDTGLIFFIILIVALVIAFLVMNQMGSLGVGKPHKHSETMSTRRRTR